jgi:hypothetical protein
MSDLMTQLRAVGHQLDTVDPGANPEKARALLRRRKELARKLQSNRENGFSHRRRERDVRAK